MVTAPPCRSDPILVPGRAVAARAHWGVPGGLVLVSVYVEVGEGPSQRNLAILHEVCSYLAVLNAHGFDWLVGGDSNMEIDEWVVSTGPMLWEVLSHSRALLPASRLLQAPR